VNYATAASYTPGGALASLTNGASLVSTYFYNNRLQPCRISVKSSGTAPVNCTDAAQGNVLDFTYGFAHSVANNGNVTSIANNRDTNRSQSFTYDELNRIATAQTQATSGTHCWGETFGYDVWGNLLTIGAITPQYNGCVQESLSVTATTKNQISGHTYDAAGNLTTAPGMGSYTYDAENRMTATVGVTYTYDGDGRRVQKSNGKLYWYGMSGLDALLETDLAGNNPTEYVFFGGKRAARRDSSGSVFYYFANHLGSANVVTNSAGTIVEESDYYPFGGERVVVNTDPNPYKFTGKERDAESNLDLLGARYYSSGSSRFTGPDPILQSELRLSNPQGWNAYAYTLNNPLIYVDLDGEEAGLFYTTKNGQPTVYSPLSREARAASASPQARVAFTGFVVTTTGGLFGPTAAVAGGQALRGLTASAITYSMTPQGQQTLANIAEGLSQAPPGSMTIIGSVTMAAASRLKPSEVGAGLRLAMQEGMQLVESSHIGAEFIDVGSKKSIDIMGGVSAFKNWNAGKFFESIKHHLGKSNDITAIDLAGASKQQIKQVKEYVSTLTKKQQAKIKYIEQ
jgi:RHS repeat-associated protein